MSINVAAFRVTLKYARSKKQSSSVTADAKQCCNVICWTCTDFFSEPLGFSAARRI